MRYRPKHIVEYGLLRLVACIVGVLPLRLALGLAWGVARLTKVVLHQRWKQFGRRLHVVFGDTFSDAERRRILWLAWRNFCFSAVELLRVGSTPVEKIKRTFSGDDVSRLTPYLADGKGAILALPHLGNWELAGVVLRHFGVPLFVIMRSQKNPLIDAYLNRMREMTAIDAVKMGPRTITGVIQKLKQGQVLAILPDIRAKTTPVTVDFLGGKADIARGMAFFAHSADVPILTVRLRREGWTRHRWELGEVVHPDAAADREADVIRMTRLVMTRLDEEIRQRPDQYFWFNKRWILGPE